MFKTLLAPFRWLWKVVDVSRRVIVNLIFFFILLLLLAALLTPKKALLPDSAALVVAPQGDIVEEYSGDPVERAIDKSLGKERLEMRLRDVVAAIDAAAKDHRIKALVLRPDEMFGGPLALTKLQEIRRAVARFRESGKPVIAYGGAFDQEQYYLAAMADEVLMHPMGFVFIEGYGHFRLYFKEALDKLAIDWNVFRVGEYKSFAEPFMRNGMSPESREADLAWLNALWEEYQADVTAARKLEADALARYVDGAVPALDRHGGDAARLALEAKLVDRLVTQDEMERHLIELVGEDEDTHSFNQIGVEDYLKAVDHENGLVPLHGADKVAVVVASGSILPGQQKPGTIGSESTGELIRRARFDDDVKALVLRVDSGGGSAFASDLILRELELVQADGKPVVVSMSSVAASGGYWISMGADEIWAHPATITGSIGVVGMFPTLQRSLEKLGIRSDGVGTTPFAGALRPDRAMSADMKRLMQLSVDHVYRQFITKTAEARDLKLEEVDHVARGRVWSGRDARRLGLVDEFGGLEEAVEAAAARAGLESGKYSVTYIEPELSFMDRLLIDMLSGAHRAGLGVTAELSTERRVERLVRGMLRAAELHDPAGMYAYCFCVPY
ncbi:MAG TPA: signal peptide peptidase SppA [Gammaproteobacteria bacterium]|nr:signal peptide peptidase SppA [Gammaproteobacteria bacterium]